MYVEMVEAQRWVGAVYTLLIPCLYAQYRYGIGLIGAPNACYLYVTALVVRTCVHVGATLNMELVL